MNNLIQKYFKGRYILGVLYFVGLFGILSDYRSFFLPLSAFQLLVSFLLILFYYKAISVKMLIGFGIIYLSTFFIEMYGVHHDWLFGAYEYGENLGWKVIDTPLIIGVNWLMLVMASCSICVKIIPEKAVWLKVLAAAVMMVGLDYLIEPVANHRAIDFWAWEVSYIPVQNFISWFIVSLVMCSVYFYVGADQRNKTARYVFVYQVIFFLVLNLFLQ